MLLFHFVGLDSFDYAFQFVLVHVDLSFTYCRYGLNLFLQEVHPLVKFLLDRIRTNVLLVRLKVFLRQEE